MLFKFGVDAFVAHKPLSDSPAITDQFLVLLAKSERMGIGEGKGLEINACMAESFFPWARRRNKSADHLQPRERSKKR